MPQDASTNIQPHGAAAPAITFEPLQNGTTVADTVDGYATSCHIGEKQSMYLGTTVNARRTPLRLLLAISASAQLFTAATAAATDMPTSQQTSTHIVEWDIPFAGDIEPGAVAVDTHGKENRVWFLTRTGAQKVYRFDPAKSLLKGSAQWTSWELSPGAVSTGGLKRLKPSDDRRYIFIRTSSNLQRVDTQNCKSGTVKTASTPATPPTCEVTVWDDKLVDQFSTSDLAIDGANRVFTTALVNAPNTPPGPGVNPDAAYVQMLIPGPAPLPTAINPTVQVKRWMVNGGAGFCPNTGSGGTCLSGVDVYASKYKNLVYYSEPAGNNIGELNIVTNVVRRWCLGAVGASGPRQLNIDDAGKIWVVTGSGHLVSLDPNTNRMSAHQVPVEMVPPGGFAESDLFGVAPDDDVIGYTNAGASENKVAMLFPKGVSVPVTPKCETLCPVYKDVPVRADVSIADSDSVPPQGKIAPVTITSKPDGIFVEARIDLAQCTTGNCLAPNSMFPRGITPNRGRAQGTFFYTVGFSGDTVRVGFARLPNKGKIKHGRDDEDCDDGEDATTHPGWHDHGSHPDDADDDGVDSKYDSRTSREDAQTGDPTALSAGQTAEYPVTASATTLALIASISADDPLAQIGVEIYNQLGALVASGVSVAGVAVATAPVPGAGIYNVRVKNYGVRTFNQTPTLLVREPWLP